LIRARHDSTVVEFQPSISGGERCRQGRDESDDD